jgi:hypothetical protein
MPDVLTDLAKPVPSIIPRKMPALSDDECLLGCPGRSASTIPTIWRRYRV